jgi:hypothetical protein
MTENEFAGDYSGGVIGIFGINFFKDSVIKRQVSVLGGLI